MGNENSSMCSCYGPETENRTKSESNAFQTKNQSPIQYNKLSK
jgi:hypothetical protein